MQKDFEIIRVLDYLERIDFHYQMWFEQVSQRIGETASIEMEKKVKELTSNNRNNRYSKIFDYNPNVSFEQSISNLELEKIIEIRKATALNWLAFDGIWFQAVEFDYGMEDAKYCNDMAWFYFSPFEANQIKKLIKLEEKCGLEGLKLAMNYRLYADINVQSIGNEKGNGFDFFMNECRVQVARNRKNLPDYPCKSAGIIEYTNFAKTIDSRISTQVIGCPPDAHPKEWYCGWRFIIEN